MNRPRTFSPAGRVSQEPETLGQKLARMARASLPVPVIVDDGERKRKRRRCACGALLHSNPKIRQKQMVCDDCADIIPCMDVGRPYAYVCAGCRRNFPRRAVWIRGGKFFCKKCLK